MWPMISPHPKPPVSSPNLKRLPKREAVTIVAGFRCIDGVVLCSDTQEVTQGYLKTRVPKLIVRPEYGQAGDLKHGIFAGAGDGPLIDKLIGRMWSVVENSSDLLEGVSEGVEEEIKKFHQELTTLYQQGDQFYPRAEIIYALSANGEIGLFKATGPIVNPVLRYETSGGGEILAKYISDRFFPEFGLPTTRQAVNLALYALNQCKEHAEGCGGDSHVVVMRDNEAPVKMDGMRVLGATWNLRDMEEIVHRLYLAVPDMELTAEEFTKEIQLFLSTIQESRQKHHDLLHRNEKIENPKKKKSNK
jgi:hypothetical protein